ncbi:MAG: hypothetical protein ACOZAO_00265 [Patescibacteria group bacterium]
MSKIMEYVRSRLGKDPILKDFFAHEEIKDVDLIVVFLLGGVGGLGHEFVRLFQKYPDLRTLIKVIKVDTHFKAGDFEDQKTNPQAQNWGIVRLGEHMDLTLQEAVAQHGVPLEAFDNEQERAEFAELVQHPEFGNRSVRWGAGALPLVGKYIMYLTQDALEDYMFEFADAMVGSGIVKNILPVAFIGTAGGTGAGIYKLALAIAESIAKERGLNGFAGIPKVFLGWRAYDNMIRRHDGVLNPKAQDAWDRSRHMWETEEDSIFVSSRLGTYGIMALLMMLPDIMAHLNNRVADRMAPNVMLISDELTVLDIKRIASAIINNGDSFDWALYDDVWELQKNGFRKSSGFVASLKVSASQARTVGDLARMKAFFASGYAETQLRRIYNEQGLDKPIDEGGVTNWTHIPGLVAGILREIDGIVQNLRLQSRASGPYLLPEEGPELLDAVRMERLHAVQNGVAFINARRAFVPTTVPDGVPHHSDERPFGPSTLIYEHMSLLRDEEGNVITGPAGYPIEEPGFNALTYDEMRQLEKKQALRKARARRTTLLK